MTCALGCADGSELKVTTPLRPLAVGATFEARFQYVNIGLNFIESISSVEVDDASVFEVNVPLTGDTFSVKALRAGQTSITVNGLDVKGAGQSASAQFHAL